MYSKKLPTISVIIPVYNDYERLHLCLHALERQTYPRQSYEIIVVDNGSNLVPKNPIPDGVKATWLQEEALGSYAARNLGIKSSTGNVLAFIDSDCIPNHDWLEKGIAALGSLKRPGYVGGRVDVFPQDMASPTPTEYYEMATAFPMEKYMRESHFGGAGNLFVDREIIAEVGPFNASLQSGGDAEFGKRVFAAGYQQFHAADVVVQHPARRRLQERLQKTYRVYSGMMDTLESGHPSGMLKAEGLWDHFKPPIRSSFRVLLSKKIPTLAGRVQATGVHLTLHYAKALEYTRTQKLGLPPKGKR